MASNSAERMTLKKINGGVTDKADEVVPGRYMYRPAEAPPDSCWLVLVQLAPLNTRAGHDSVAARFSAEKKGKFIWRWEESLSCDFDFPTYLAPELGSEHIASCLWIFLGEYKAHTLLEWLKTLHGKRQAVNIPDGKARMPRKARMFDPAGVDFAQGKTIHHETYAHPAQAALAALLANLEIRGAVELPTSESDCLEWRKAVEKRLADARRRFDELADSGTCTRKLRDATARLLMQWFIHGWR